MISMISAGPGAARGTSSISAGYGFQIRLLAPTPRNDAKEGHTMPEAHEHIEHAEHAEHAAGWSKKIALLIAVLALFLSFSETLGKSAQTEALDANVKSAD